MTENPAAAAARLLCGSDAVSVGSIHEFEAEDFTLPAGSTRSYSGGSLLF